MVAAIPLLMLGLYFALAGLFAECMVAYQVLRMIIDQDRVNPLVGFLLLSYGAIFNSGALFCLASYYCGTGRWQRAMITILAAGLFWASFFWISPGPIPLDK